MKTHSLHGAALVASAAIVLVFGLGIGTPRAASQCGKAAWYDRPGKAASGEQASATAMVAAHRSLPFGTHVRVENLSNGRSVIVRINDRGPAERDRVIDVSRSAAAELGFISAGITEVKLTTLDGASAALDRPCLDDAVVSSSATPLPRTRPKVGAAPVAAAMPGYASDAMAARFGLAFQEDDWMPQEMAKAIEALTAPH